MLADARRMGQPKPEHFEPDWWRAAGRIIGEATGRGSAWFIDVDNEQWVLRHYRRGGVVGRFNQDAYLFTGEARSRPVRELRLLAEMEGRGLPVPAPVAMRLQRHGLFYRADLLTVRVPGRPLSALLADGAADPALFAVIGEVIGRFHREGVFHADLNAHNILVDGHSVHLIDFDRGEWRSPGRWQRANLDRLQRSLRKLLADQWRGNAHWLQCWLALEQAWQEALSPETPIE